MATTYATDFEKGRIAAAALEARRIRAFLAYDPTLSLNENSLRTAWEGLALPNTNGYNQVTFVIPTGAYDVGDDRYEVGGTAGAYYSVTYSATGVGYTYSRVCWVVGTSNGVGGWNEETKLSYITNEDPFLQLLASQSKTYNFQIGVRGALA